MSQLSERVVAQALTHARTAPTGIPAVPVAPTEAPARPWVAGIAAAVALAATLSALIIGSADGLPTGAFGRVVSGSVTASPDTGGSYVVRAGETIPDDAFVVAEQTTTITTETAELEMRPDSAIVGSERIAITRGSVLIRADDIAATARNAEIDGSGTWRFDVAASSRVGVFAGTATVTTRGRTYVAKAHEQLDLVRPTAGAVALQYSADDAWDAQELADVIALDAVIGAIGDSFTARLGTEPVAASTWAALFGSAGAPEVDLRQSATVVVDGRDPAFGPVGELARNRVIVAAMTQIGQGEASLRVRHARDRGATWGIVAASNNLAVSDLSAVADRVLSGTQAAASAAQLPVGPLALPVQSAGVLDPASPAPVQPQPSTPSETLDPATPDPSDTGPDPEPSGLDGVLGPLSPQPSESSSDPTPLPTLPVPAAPSGLSGGFSSQNNTTQPVAVGGPAVGKSGAVNRLSLSTSARAPRAAAVAAPQDAQQMAMSTFSTAPDGRLLPVVAPAPASTVVPHVVREDAVIDLASLPAHEAFPNLQAASIPLGEVRTVASERPNRVAQGLISVAFGLLAGAAAALTWTARLRGRRGIVGNTRPSWGDTSKT